MPSDTNRVEHSIAQRCVEEIRPLRVVTIGAGVSGLVAAIKLSQKVERLDLVIYEKNVDIGGTWFENQYPGCACDIPAHCYQLSFESNPAWSSFYAGSGEILSYWKRIAEKYDLYKYIHLSTKVEEARWNEDTAKWHVKLHDLKSGRHFEDIADVIVQGSGALNEWKWPNIQGLHDFEGKLLHSAAWDTNYDYKGKRVAVIGAGSSGIQITPTVQPDVAQLYQFVRGKTWISNQFVDADVVARLGDSGGNFKFTEAEIKGWLADPQSYLAYRRILEDDLQSHHASTLRGSVEQVEARKAFTQLMKDRLARKSELVDVILPDFPPVCKRLTPGPGFLEALTQDNVEVVSTPIAKVDASGVITSDGTHRAVDAIMCATGFDTTFAPRFPCYGRGGVQLADKWREYPVSYLSMAVDDFPNFFISLGPNAGLGSGNLLVLIEQLLEYVAEACAKMQREAIRSMAPTARSVAGFKRHCQQYFKGTVFSDECSSWYKGGKKTGDVLALWPGSSLHAVAALQHPRWEDWEYEYDDANDMAWFGDGWSVRDKGTSLDRTYYLSGRVNLIQDPLGKSIDGAKVDEEVNTNGMNGSSR